MTKLEPLTNLNDLHRGIHKQWIWQWRDNYYTSCDYLQKINYSIQDLNNEIEGLASPTNKDVIYVIVLIDWICKAVCGIQNLLIAGIKEAFKYEKQDEINKAHKFFEAVRAFVVAHPLSTTRHEAYGFDGGKICIDIRIGVSEFLSLKREADLYHLDFSGLKPRARDVNADFYLMIYSKHPDNMEFSKYIGVCFSDLYHVAEVYIDKLYAIDRYLEKVKKKDWM